MLLQRTGIKSLNKRVVGAWCLKVRPSGEPLAHLR
ncbi:MAG: hypothetical protein ACI9FJ_001692 [Alteromonadaceae bacterium]|jgi:hypothetical protein